MGTYIPDLTERFPEGFGGVDLTDSYFPSFHQADPYRYVDEDLIGYNDLPEEEEEGCIMMEPRIRTNKVKEVKREIIEFNYDGYDKDYAKGHIRLLEEAGEINPAEAERLLRYVDSFDWDEDDIWKY